MEEDRLYYESDDRKRGEVSNHDDSPMPGGDDGMYEDVDTIEDGVVESFLIIAVAAAIVWLIYYRQQRQLAADNRNRQAVQGANGQGAQAQDGFFPPVGDPARAEWVAGGIGH